MTGVCLLTGLPPAVSTGADNDDDDDDDWIGLELDQTQKKN